MKAPELLERGRLARHLLPRDDQPLTSAVLTLVEQSQQPPLMGDFVDRRSAYHLECGVIDDPGLVVEFPVRRAQRTPPVLGQHRELSRFRLDELPPARQLRGRAPAGAQQARGLILRLRRRHRHVSASLRARKISSGTTSARCHDCSHARSLPARCPGPLPRGRAPAGARRPWRWPGCGLATLRSLRPRRGPRSWTVRPTARRPPGPTAPSPPGRSPAR
jgi:hypothetical protein